MRDVQKKTGAIHARADFVRQLSLRATRSKSASIVTAQ
jgi:hypothetical protein